jgi:valyl-tRNA synthetase
MPFVTEELWQNLKEAAGASELAESIMIAPYPVADQSYYDAHAERIVGGLSEIVRAVRNTRAEYEVAPDRLVETRIYAGEMTSAFKPYVTAMENLAKLRTAVLAANRGQTPPRSLVLVLKEAEVVIPMSSLFDLEAETARLEKELQEAAREQARLETHINDSSFLARAPEAVVVKEKERLNTVIEKQKKLREHLARLRG